MGAALICPNPTIWLDSLGVVKYVAIGEGQSSVEAFASGMRKKRPCDEFRTIEKEWSGLMSQSGTDKLKLGSDKWERSALDANADWIIDRNRDGYSFIDISGDGSPNKSSFYIIGKHTLHQIGGKVYNGAPKTRSTSKPSARPKSKVLCPL